MYMTGTGLFTSSGSQMRFSLSGPRGVRRGQRLLMEESKRRRGRGHESDPISLTISRYCHVLLRSGDGVIAVNRVIFTSMVSLSELPAACPE